MSRKPTLQHIFGGTLYSQLSPCQKKKGYEWLPNGEIIWVDEAFSHEIEKILQETNDDNERLCSRKQCTE